jgi:hypothetical protein
LKQEGPAGSLLVLNPAVAIEPVTAFPATVRERLGGSPDDYVLAERRSRYAAQRITADTAALLRCFAEPVAPAAAIVAYAQDAGEDPAELVEAIYPLILRFREQRVLVEPGTADPPRDGPRFSPGDRIAGCEVSRLVEAITETEIYAVRLDDGRSAAMKWVPAGAPDFVVAALDAEREALTALASAGAEGVSRLVGGDTLPDGSRILLLAWIDGLPLSDLAGGAIPPADRARLAVGLVERYAALHAHGWLHVDVHPRNVIGGIETGFVLIDFGSAARIDAARPRPRAGILTDYEPEAAQAVLDTGFVPPPSPAGEQYAVAALAYRLLTGEPPLDLPLEGGQALLRIAQAPPRTLSEAAGLVWPAVDSVLMRALAKDPSARFPAMGDFAAALRRAAATPAHAADPLAAPAGRAGRGAPLADLLAMLGPASPLAGSGIRRGPAASLYHGAAGLAFALWRAAMLTGSAEALAAADMWVQAGLASLDGPAAFDGRAIGMDPRDIGPAALHHRQPGLFLVEALVRDGFADRAGARAGVEACLDALAHAASDARFTVDLMNGPGGHLLALTQLRPIASGDLPLEAVLSAHAASARARLLDAVDAWTAADGETYLGYAHGVAGALHALCVDGLATAPSPPDPRLVAALDRLAGMAKEDGAGLSWPVQPGRPATWPGWCHGSAGHALLWLAAARLFGREDDMRRAAGAARSALALAGRDASSSLCCGRAGVALAAAAAARATGAGVLVDQARALLAAGRPDQYGEILPHSLFRGETGVLLARLELERPDLADFPLVGLTPQDRQI